jgi:DNA polymerase-3 subunit epsilon
VEIGCVELKDQISTDKTFHAYINPQREVSGDAFKVHGYSNKFLSDKKTFPEIVEEFLSFIKDKKLIIHNATFDLSFLDYELKLINKKPIDKKNVIDTLELAREKFPGSQNSLDALCKRFNIDNSRREKHSALVDCQLLKEAYINLLDQKEPKLKLETRDIYDIKLNNKLDEIENIQRKVIKISKKELELHKKFLKTSLQRNFFK